MLKSDCGISLGQKFTSKKTGCPCVALCVTIYLNGDIFSLMKYGVIAKDSPLQVWFDLYPDWHTKEVVIGYFSSPQRPISLDEFVSANDYLNDYDIKTRTLFYEKMINPVPCAAYPIDDVEFLE